MAFVEWSDKFSVGITSIDNQHKKLVEIVNKLHTAMLAGKGNEILGGIFNELVKYTSEHFATEEMYFKVHKYSQEAIHKKEHEDLVKQALELQKKFAAGGTGVTMSTATFLKDWLGKHILNSDKAYSEFLIGKGVK
jgi:hemerythrin